MLGPAFWAAKCSAVLLLTLPMLRRRPEQAAVFVVVVVEEAVQPAAGGAAGGVKGAAPAAGCTTPFMRPASPSFSFSSKYPIAARSVLLSSGRLSFFAARRSSTAMPSRPAVCAAGES